MNIEPIKRLIEATSPICEGAYGDDMDKAYEDTRQAIVEAEKQEQGEPVAYIHRNEYDEYRLEPHDNFDIKSIPFNVDVPLFKAPQQRKPLNQKQINRLIKDAGYGDEQNEAISNFINGVAFAEAAHGIKGEA